MKIILILLMLSGATPAAAGPNGPDWVRMPNFWRPPNKGEDPNDQHFNLDSRHGYVCNTGVIPTKKTCTKMLRVGRMLVPMQPVGGQ